VPVESFFFLRQMLDGSLSLWSRREIKNTAFELFLFFYYNQVLGLSGSLAGLALSIALCVDGITDPLVGSLSGGSRSRWGRRHPWMYLAAPPLALSFYFLFSPPGPGPEILVRLVARVCGLGAHGDVHGLSESC
jgi:MFS transporter